MTLLENYSEVYFHDGLVLDDARTRYHERRIALGNACGCPYVIRGILNDLGHPYPWATVHTPYFQDPLFQFLTGINQTQCALFVDVKRNHFKLFLPKKDPKKEFWDGIRLGCGTLESEQEATHLTGLEVSPIEMLEPYIQSYVFENHISELALFWHEHQKNQPEIQDFHAQFKSNLIALLSENAWNGIIHNLSPFQWPLRLCLDSVDLDLFRKANVLTLEALAVLEKQLPLLKSEQDASGILHGELLKRSSKGLSFYPIVASGANAAVLHYHKNDALFKPNTLLLVDCGLRHHSMPADVTRTYPINGYLNPLQALLMSIVEDTQSAVEASVKEGTTIAAMNTTCWSTMDQLLEDRFLSKGGIMRRAYERIPHNVSHLIGLAVHDGDPYRNYRDMPLKTGMVISNEPGLYGEFELTIDGIHYREHIGIRIEDDLAVTKTGVNNLTRNN